VMPHYTLTLSGRDVLVCIAVLLFIGGITGWAICK
jgi:hypothetical protein